MTVHLRVVPAPVDHRTLPRKGAKARALLPTLSRMTAEERDAVLADRPEAYWRPKTRGDCANVPRPCPYAGCKFNLYLDPLKGGNIRATFPDIEPGDMKESCALDIADRGGATLEEVAACLNVTRQRIEQAEKIALMKLFNNKASRLRDFR